MAPLLRTFGGRWKGRPLQSVTYDAILFKRFTITSSFKRPDSALINYVWQNVFAKEDMIVDSKAMRVGNREGLGWMERMERMIDQLREDSKMQKMINEKHANKSRSQEIIITQQNLIISQHENELKAQNLIISQHEDELKAQNLKAQNLIISQHGDELKAQKRIWCSIRAAEIERHGDYRTEEATLARSERNEVVHGGNIVGDLHVLEFLKIDTPERYDSIREAFEAWYEISVQYKDRIVHAPKLIIEAFDTLANTKSLWKWRKNRKSQEEAQKICRGMISRWLEYVNTAKGEYPEDLIRREFDKLVTLRST